MIIISAHHHHHHHHSASCNMCMQYMHLETELNDMVEEKAMAGKKALEA